MDADSDLRHEVVYVALFGETLLDRDGAVDGVGRVREDSEEAVAVATLFHFDPMVPGKEFADRQIVTMQDPRPCFVAVLRDESGRVDDVCEHEGALNGVSDRRGAEPVAKALGRVEVTSRAEVLERRDRGVDLDDRDCPVIEP